MAPKRHTKPSRSSCGTRQLKSPIIILLTIMFLMASCPYTAVAASGGAMGGGGFSGGASSSGAGGGGFSSSGSGKFYLNRVRVSYKSSSPDVYGGRMNNDDSGDKSSHTLILCLTIVLVMIIVIMLICVFSNHAEEFSSERVQRTSVIKLQVSLNGMARSFQSDLDAIAGKADTLKRSGYKYVLEESAKALLRHSNFCLASYLSIEPRSDTSRARSLFNKISNEERRKFDQETLTNIDNYKRQSSMPGVSGFSNPFILVTFLLGTTELLQLRPINTRKDLQAILQKLIAVPESGIVAAHVLWTPQKKNDCLTQQRLLQDYPYLRQLNVEEVFISID